MENDGAVETIFATPGKYWDHTYKDIKDIERQGHTMLVR